MTKQEFLNLLKSELEKNNIQKVNDIVNDYEEHFSHGLSKGKTESEIAANLGSPSVIAKAYQTEVMIKEVKNPGTEFQWKLALNIIARLLIIAPFNLIVLFIPGIMIFSFLTTGWAIALAMGSISMALLWMLPTVGALALSGWAWIAGISASFGFIGLCVLTGIVMFLITKYILLALISYLQWNLKFITEK